MERKNKMDKTSIKTWHNTDRQWLGISGLPLLYLVLISLFTYTNPSNLLWHVQGGFPTPRILHHLTFPIHLQPENHEQSSRLLHLNCAVQYSSTSSFFNWVRKAVQMLKVASSTFRTAIHLIASMAFFAPKHFTSHALLSDYKPTHQQISIAITRKHGM